MFTHLRPAVVIFIALTLLTGIAYPLLVTAFALVAFPDKAEGSLVLDAQGRPVGSRLIGQDFSAGDPAAAAAFLWGRPSATGPLPYTSLNTSSLTGSSGSNLGPSNPALLANVQARAAALAAADKAVGLNRPEATPIPVDLLCASASGLDPHISLAGAEYQVPRIALARKISEAAVRAIILAATTDRTFGLFGEPVVNVLLVNRALATPAAAAPQGPAALPSVARQ